jgi:hypothetical protein
LRDVALVVAFLVLLFYLRGFVTPTSKKSPTPPPRPALDFKLIAERFVKVRLHANREEVEQLLGPPSSPDSSWEPFLSEWGSQAYYSNRGLPEDRYWDVWIDPNQEGRGVAILYANGKVLSKEKRGF